MTISAITGLAVQQTMPNLAQINRINPVGGQDADGDNDGSSGAKPAGKVAKPAAAPKLVQAILQGLSQLGASNTANVTGINGLKASDSANSSPSNSNSSSKDLAQKLSGFVQTLMDALQSNDGSKQASGQSTSAAQYQQAGASIDNSIQSLLDKVTANQNSSDLQSVANVGNQGGTQSGVLAALQQSASQLFAAAGVPPAGQSLSNLLQAVQKPLTDSAQVGTIVNTVA